MRFSWQVHWGGLPFPASADQVLSEFSAWTWQSWVALHGMAHSFIELHKFLCHDKAVILKPLTVWIMTSCGKLLQRWKYQTILPVS